MAKSDKKYADPTGVLKAVTNDFGQPVEIGSEQDIGEFNNTLLSRLQEGLNYKKIYAKKVKEKREKKEAEIKSSKPQVKADDDAIMFEESKDGVPPNLVQ